MDSPWYSLMTNVAVVAFFIGVWTQLRDLFERFGPRAYEATFGMVMGVGAIVTMLFPIEFGPGVLFDLRTCLIVIAAFFGGPLSGLIAAVLAGGVRLAIGGVGAPTGLFAIAFATLMATLGHLSLRRHGLRPERWHAVVLAVATCAVSILAVALTRVNSLAPEWPMLMASRTLVLFLAVLISSLALIHDEERLTARHENQVYRKVIEALPDSISVRDLGGRFVAANPATAALFGAPSPAAMIGRSPDAFSTGSNPLPREVEITAKMPPGPSTFQQALRLPDGTTTWLQTLEVPLNDDQGRPIGLITHNRDITAQKRLEMELDERQRVLSFAMAQMSDGVAMFDRTGRLLFCNSRYRELFPLTSDVRVPGAQIRDILATAVARREQQVGASTAETVAWIDEVANSLDRDGEEEVHLFDGTWLRVSTRPSPDGVAMVVVSDITRLKRTELELLDVTEQLRQEATTDPLTGLLNRRALDQRLEIEIARSLRIDSQISLILLDIDHFKAYNDTYGHLAGDECLKAVSQCLGEVFRRPTDLVARYGGEEFLVVLPDADADLAYRFATEYRTVLNAKALPHEASTFGHVTVSLGFASYVPGETERTAADLIGRADEALYAAKTAGRDRVSGWRRRFGVVPRRLRVVH